ncbi:MULTISPECIES: hypothetical protein [unclassified Pseudomonas]|uniref:hypothetical protein n=1 Tax=unclassified Pseudomonas TaxID=196821 RepID=UPI00119BC0F3|nr:MULTISPECIES: hypothetical protein [unclassified Pseudomonas]TWC17009.1 hypothetical protein FBY00_110168 [Pseudomonas sp. SJZ075]TWC25773.1 hypothetical protein FBX99_101312 [Pseudomonas sp. SJZ074]TWC33054.1 hypothetical protein FBY02_110168 [Pseudomonas sp. SJZ078]TWC42584.1 hypothetical protein FBY06_101312 [Pseudomonas sp. SJZ085]TWC53652.1 hypothetical protein FBY11_1104 [Pseudomonas sp. SJZ124]
MNPIHRFIRITGPGLVVLLIGTYTGFASAATYTCEYYSSPNNVRMKTITVNATSTSDALAQAKASFQRESFYNAQQNLILCNP